MGTRGSLIPKKMRQITLDVDPESLSLKESGGTVLSTNWKEVGKGKVDVKPPDGMEYKHWND